MNKKQVIRLNESQLRRIVKESVKRVLYEENGSILPDKHYVTEYVDLVNDGEIDIRRLSDNDLYELLSLLHSAKEYLWTDSGQYAETEEDESEIMNPVFDAIFEVEEELRRRGLRR